MDQKGAAVVDTGAPHENRTIKTIAGRYELGRVLGRGPTATVRVAIELETRKEYAVKVIVIDDNMKRAVEDAVRREIAILKTMRHRNVVALKEVLQSKNNLYIFMELVNGGSLLEEIDRSPQRRFTEEKARRYFQQLILGLRYVHRLDISHRDLKPLNLLLDQQGNMKISDFGFANMQTEKGTMTTIYGTPHFVAPEMLSNSAYAYDGSRIDIWSAGVILYVMLTGALPFSHSDRTNYEPLWAKIRQGEFHIPRWVSFEAQELLVRMLEVDSELRCSLEYVISHPWFQEGFDRKWFEEGTRIAPDTGEPIQEAASTYGNPAVLSAHITPQHQISKGALLSAFETCDHLRAFIFNADHTQRAFLYSRSILETLKELIQLLTRLNYNPKTVKDAFEIKAFSSIPRLVTFTVSLESLVIPSRTLVEVSLVAGQPADLALPNSPFDEIVRLIRANLTEQVSREEEPVVDTGNG